MMKIYSCSENTELRDGELCKLQIENKVTDILKQ